MMDGNTPRYGSLVKQAPFVKLQAYNGSEIVQVGKIEMQLRFGESSDWTVTEFFIAETPGPIIMGKKTSQILRIITINSMSEMTIRVMHNITQETVGIPDKESLLELYPDRFMGLGKFPGKYHIDMKPDAEPVIRPPRRYPIHLKGEIEAEITGMLEMDVLEPIPENESTEWLNSLAFSRKESGKLRVCLDPRDLNVAIKRTYHRTPTIEEITHKLSGAGVFSKLDARHGYWSVELDEESKKLTSFSAPEGRYWFKRLPFGLKVAQDVFQEKMDVILAGCKGTINISDDIVVFGSSVEEHDSNLHKLMSRARECGLVFNPEKCVIRSGEVNFFGMKYTTDGVKPDPRKASEIANLPSPTCLKELQQFLGMVQYLAPFIPNLSDRTSMLRDLIKKEIPWEWTPTHQKFFQDIKSAICNAVTLNYFDPNLQTKVQVDASQKGLGAALIQTDSSGKEKVIAFASKALTPTEQRYANIEREMLAVVFGAERFHTFLYGSLFVVETDHKPLESIQLKSLSQAPPRLQRMLLRLQQYDMTIKYRPGKDLLLADALSRLCPKSAGMIKLETTIHTVK